MDTVGVSITLERAEYDHLSAIAGHEGLGALLRACALREHPVPLQPEPSWYVPEPESTPVEIVTAPGE